MRNNVILRAFIIAVLLCAAGSLVLGDPVGVRTLGTPVDTRGDYGSVSGASDSAYAGNITELFPNATMITNTWQGYYGNISGKIVLDNANNMSMYDWDVTSPSGTILAANETISDWSNIKCFNYTDPNDLNLSILEQDILNCSGDDDGVDETFDSTTHDAIIVGTTTFTDECNATSLYVNDGPNSASFDEALLYEATNNVLIYATPIYDDTTGFDNTPTDFQLIVGEDGHNGDTSTTPYYFYIELT